MKSRIRLRHILRPREVTGRAHLQVLSVYRDHGVVPKNSRSDNFNKTPADLSRYQEVRVGDLVVNKMKAWQGSLAVSTQHGIVSPDYQVCSIDPVINSRFLHYLLRSPSLIAEYRTRSKGIRPAQWRLYWDNLADISVEIPDESEQRRIADVSIHG
jgi:type I restriction enzyme S subunit